MEGPESSLGASSLFNMDDLYPTLHRWALYLTHDDQDADDLCQEVCLRVLLGKRNFRGDSKPTTWLFRITMNSYTDLRRKRSGCLETKESDLSENFKKVCDDYACRASTTNSSLMEHVQDVLRRMTPRQRQLLEWKYVQGLSHAEIASTLHIQEESVCRSICRARASFKISFEWPSSFLKPETSNVIDRNRVRNSRSPQ